jgi:hypothetical protein
MAKRGPGRDARLERRWRGVLRRFGRSGKTVREFCLAEKLSEPSFYAWRRELARRDGTAVPGRRGAAPLFLPVRLAEGGGAPAAGLIEVRLSSGHVLRGSEPEKLARLAALLKC